MNTNAIVTRHEIAIEGVNELMHIVRTMREKIFVQGIDYGVIPGTNDKPTLLLPGMEKLLRGLRLTTQYIPLTIVEDFDKPLFVYRYECRLVDEFGVVVGAAIGSANSYETKWRWRQGKRLCPKCGKETIIKGKEEYGGGWVCWKGKEGCGAKFADNDPEIINQSVERILNEAIFDQINTIDKIAQKRSLGSAIKCAAAVSELFTVDLEDMPGYDILVDLKQPEPPKPPVVASPPAPANPYAAAVEKAAEAPQLTETWTKGDWSMFWKDALPLYDNAEHGRNSINLMAKEGRIELGAGVVANKVAQVKQHVEESKVTA